MTMTATVTTIGTRPGLEALVDRVIEALFGAGADEPEPTPAQSLGEARRLRRCGEPDAALALLAELDVTAASSQEARRAHAEWRDHVRRRFGAEDILVYSQDTGRAAALVPQDDETLEVLAALGMRWRPGKVLSRRTLRGLKPLKEGASWS